MNFRSTNAVGYVHFGGDLVAGVGSSHGVQLVGGSTGGNVQPCGDDDNITLTVKGKGTGGVVVGAGSAFKGAYSKTAAYTFTALAAHASEEFVFTSTTADITPGDMVTPELGLPATSTQTISLVSYRTSAAASSRVVVTLANLTSTAIGSTGSGTMRLSWLDLT